MSTKVKTPPPRLTRSEQREANRVALVTAARRLVDDGGYDAKEVHDVAAQCGLTKGAVYSIFGSKLDLLWAVVEVISSEIDPLLHSMQAFGPDASVEDILEGSWHDLLLTMYTTSAGDATRLQVDLLPLALRHPEMRERINRINGRSFELFDTVFAGHPTRSGRVYDEDDSRDLAHMVVSLLRGINIGRIVDGYEPEPDLVLRSLIGLVRG